MFSKTPKNRETYVKKKEKRRQIAKIDALQLDPKNPHYIRYSGNLPDVMKYCEVRGVPHTATEHEECAGKIKTLFITTDKSTYSGKKNRPADHKRCPRRLEPHGDAAHSFCKERENFTRKGVLNQYCIICLDRRKEGASLCERCFDLQTSGRYKHVKIETDYRWCASCYTVSPYSNSPRCKSCETEFQDRYKMSTIDHLLENRPRLEQQRILAEARVITDELISLFESVVGPENFDRAATYCGIGSLDPNHFTPYRIFMSYRADYAVLCRVYGVCSTVLRITEALVGERMGKIVKISMNSENCYGACGPRVKYAYIKFSLEGEPLSRLKEGASNADTLIVTGKILVSLIRAFSLTCPFPLIFSALATSTLKFSDGTHSADRIILHPLSSKTAPESNNSIANYNV